jgi:pimeloyl-ACP methyl ester carboxylesterase
MGKGIHQVDHHSNALSITLADGRRLGHALYGDIEGKPLFFFHGWPGSRLRAKVYAEIASALHIALIAIDRPGIGLSDVLPKRTLLDWPTDVTQLADHLKLDQFALMGISGGGPYAAACAYKIPERITKAGIVVGAAPLNVPGILDGLLPLYKRGWQGYARLPLMAYVSSLLHALSARHFPSLLRATYRSDADQAVYRLYGGDLLLAKQECFRQSFRNAAMDVLIGTRPWGFDLDEIDAKVYLWYGGGDPAISVRMGQYLAAQIRGSELTIYPHEGHLLSITHAKEILATLVATNKPPSVSILKPKRSLIKVQKNRMDSSKVNQRR